MRVDNLPLDNRYALFFDFLGTSEAAITWPRERIYQVVDLLISIAQSQCAEDISGNAQPDGSYRILIKPEITTFSDNVVLSYRDPEYPDDAPSEERPNDAALDSLKRWWAGMVCADASRILASVAEQALRIGVLIRGGLSWGQLYHQSGVVFGEAMVDAYRLENGVAHTPRVVVSERVIRKLRERPESVTALHQDSDGVWCLDYLPRMVELATAHLYSRNEQAIAWKRQHLKTIDATIEELSRNVVTAKQLAKWQSFKQRFVAATARIEY